MSTPRKTIDLSKCKVGQRVRLRNGKKPAKKAPERLQKALALHDSQVTDKAAIRRVIKLLKGLLKP